MIIENHNLQYNPSALSRMGSGESIAVSVARNYGLRVVIYVDDNGCHRYGLTMDEPRRLRVDSHYISAPSVGDRVFSTSDLLDLVELLQSA